MTPDAERPPVGAAAVSVVVPVRDIGKAFDRFIVAWQDGLRRLGKSFQFIVVDDGSAEPIESAAVRHEARCGLGAALRSGLEQATEPLVLIIVPEMAYRPADLPALFAAIDTADVVAPVRPGRPRPRWLDVLGRLMRRAARILIGVTPPPPPPWYDFAAWRDRLYYRALYGLRLQDPGCGLKLIRKAVLDRCPVQSDGRYALVELMAKLNFAGALFAEVELNRPGDLPTMQRPFEENLTDRSSLLRRPVFDRIEDRGSSSVAT